MKTEKGLNEKEPLFSVVIITKNEEKNIERCLTSVNMVFKELDFSREIILVDSNSSDLTVKKAINLKIDKLMVLRIVDANSYNAAIGRNVGNSFAKGKFLLFLDGDMKLHKDFLVGDAFKFVQEKEDCAGLIGIRNDIIKTNNDVKIVGNYYNIQKLKVARHFGGALLIKRKVFNEIGTYNENINSFEEPELYLRLKTKGYTVYETPELMIDHYDKPNKKLNKIKALVFSKRGLGLGQVIKSNIFTNSIKNMMTHRPIGQLFIPVILDVFSSFFLLLSIVNIYFIIVFLSIQFINFLVCSRFFDPKKFIVSKLYIIPTIIGMFYKENINYKIERIL